MTITITDLPLPIYRLIRDYVYLFIPSAYLNDQVEFEEFDGWNYLLGKRSWRNFLTISGQCYWREHVRKELLLLSLNRHLSLSYLHDESFRKKCLSLIKDPVKQLTLDLSQAGIYNLTQEQGDIISHTFAVDLGDNPLVELPPIKNVYDLDLRECKNLETAASLTSIHFLAVSKSNDLDPSFVDLEEVHGLDMGNLEVDFENNEKKDKPLQRLRVMQDPHLMNHLHLLKNLIDLQLLNDVREDTHGIPLTTPLPALRILKLTGIRVPDISIYPLLEELAFRGERIEKGMEALTNLRSLKTISDWLPEDFTLCHHPKLRYLLYDKISEKDLDHGAIYCPQLYSLALGSSDFAFDDAHVRFIQSLKKLRCLKIDNGEALINLSPFGAIPYLTIIDCLQVESFDGLGHGNVDLMITNARKVKTLPHSFITLRRLRLEDCVSLETINPVFCIESVTIKGSGKLSEGLSHFGDLLEIRNQHQTMGEVVLESEETEGETEAKEGSIISKVDSLPSAPAWKYQLINLDLTACFQLQDEQLELFRDIPYLTISYCPYITKIDMLRNEKLTAIHCLRLRSIQIHGQQWQRINLSLCKRLNAILVFGHVKVLCVREINPTPEITMIGSGKVQSIVRNLMWTNDGNFDYGTDDSNYGMRSRTLAAGGRIVGSNAFLPPMFHFMNFIHNFMEGPQEAEDVSDSDDENEGENEQPQHQGDHEEEEDEEDEDEDDAEDDDEPPALIVDEEED